MKYLIIVLWFLIFGKKMLFWIYLWQLKEYQLTRFKAHFQTSQGKRTIINYLLISKLILSPFLFFYFYYFFWALFLIFSIEAFIFSFRLFKNNFKRPVFTKKIISIAAGGFILEILILYRLFFQPENIFYFSLLILDISAPLFFSGLVFIFEPIAIFSRKKTIKKATQKRKQFKNLTVIGITGSYGKTSTKEILSTILSEKFKVLKTKEHQNSEMGISRCILNDLNFDHQIFICEMGAYKKGGIKLLTDIVQPKIGILTGINEQHLATFGSLENIIKAKYELIENLPFDGLAVFNGSNKHCFSLFEKTNLPKKITNKDILAENVRVEKEFIYFRIRINNEAADFKINLLGSYWIENILLAILTAKELGMSLEEISQNCLKIRPLSGAMRLVKNPNGLNLINATYSANPNSVISHLDYLKVWPGKKIIIMPCLIELGKASKEIHQKIGKAIEETCDLAIITSQECLESLKVSVISKKILFLEKPKDIYDKIKEFSGQEDVILLESRLPKELISLLNLNEH